MRDGQLFLIDKEQTLELSEIESKLIGLIHAINEADKLTDQLRFGFFRGIDVYTTADARYGGSVEYSTLNDTLGALIEKEKVESCIGEDMIIETCLWSKDVLYIIRDGILKIQTLGVKGKPKSVDFTPEISSEMQIIIKGISDSLE